MSTALALIDESQYGLMAKLAKVAAMSGYSKQNETQAMFIMLKGFELGISPMQALDGIQVIQGKTTVSPQLMLALINRSGLLEDIDMDGDAKSYTVMMKRVGRSAHTETFTIENAKSMQLSSKDNWQKQPAVMLKWRAVSACARVVFPDVIQGMYTPEEMGAEVSENDAGEIVIEQPPLAVLPPPHVDVSTGEVVEGKVIEDAPISQNTATSSDLPPENEPTLTTPQIAAATAKSRFAGNGAPPAGEKKTIAKKNAVPGWRTSANEVFKTVRPLYSAHDHMINSIEKLTRDGVITDDMPAGVVIPIIQNHKDDTQPPF